MIHRRRTERFSLPRGFPRGKGFCSKIFPSPRVSEGKVFLLVGVIPSQDFPRTPKRFYKQNFPEKRLLQAGFSRRNRKDFAEAQASKFSLQNPSFSIKKIISSPFETLSPSDETIVSSVKTTFSAPETLFSGVERVSSGNETLSSTAGTTSPTVETTFLNDEETFSDGEKNFSEAGDVFSALKIKGLRRRPRRKIRHQIVVSCRKINKISFHLSPKEEGNSE